MPSARATSDPGALEQTELAPGVILVSPHGQIRILRSRTSSDTGWNCSDGAAIDDDLANDLREWMPYTPEQLAADLQLAREVSEIAGHRALSGGLATWDACSGRPCVLPKLAKLVR
jgi:hypothetical protein